jgi:hypothetical protein
MSVGQRCAGSLLSWHAGVSCIQRLLQIAAKQSRLFNAESWGHAGTVLKAMHEPMYTLVTSYVGTDRLLVQTSMQA